MEEFLKSRLPALHFKDLLLDLEDRLRAEALRAHKMVHEHSGLDHKRERKVEGHARFPMMEKGFVETCLRHGGTAVPNGVLLDTKHKIHQPFMRFEINGQGFLFGLATISEPKALPTKNISRRSGVTLNYNVSARLDLDGTGPKIGDIFVLLLAARDRGKAGQIFEFAIGLINSKYNHYLAYVELSEYLRGFSDIPSTTTDVDSRLEKTPAVRLKKAMTPFIPPEGIEATKSS